MWLFEGTKTYTEMRQKIAHAVFYISLIQIFVLAQISPDFSEVLKSLSFNTETEIINIKIYIAYIYLPILFSVLENIFRVHDRIGNLFKIRDTYAGNVIFMEYINVLEIDTKGISRKDIRKIYWNNEKLRTSIGNHFYAHVSSTNPKIDEHYVQMALTSWSWVWIILDSIIITILLGLTAVFWSVSYMFILGVIIFVVLQVALLIIVLVCECKAHTIKEIHHSVKFDKEKNNNSLNDELKEVITNALSN